MGKSGLGYAHEEDLQSGLITRTVTIGPGNANPGVVVSAANILELAKESVSREITPSLIVNDADFLGSSPLGSQFLL